MKTARTLYMLTVLLMVTISSGAQTIQQKAGQYPVKVIRDTISMKNTLHFQSLADTTIKFMIWHDTVYIFMLHAEGKPQESMMKGRNKRS